MTRFPIMSGRLDGGWDHYCSQECLTSHHAESWEPINETARLGVAFMNATLMFHMMLACGRGDEPDTGQALQAKRMAIAKRLQELSELPEVKEIL